MSGSHALLSSDENSGTIKQAVQAPDRAQDRSGAPALQRRNPRYQIEEGDVLDLSFPFTPEFDQTLTVQPDGYINLKGVGDLHAEGLTVPELRDQLQKSYAGILHNPVITVTLKEFDKPYFLALGQVARPGKYDLRGDTTLTQALAMAGGLNDKAKHSQVLLFRRVSPDWVEAKKLDVKRMLNGGDLSEDLHLQPGDMVYVPQNRVSKIKPFIPLPTLGAYLR
ncbi:MAG: polysaccharide export protein [Acidobacteriia bacterium]|nr:polysaccharide export protein [Terriglobia bacterium]